MQRLTSLGGLLRRGQSGGLLSRAVRWSGAKTEGSSGGVPQPSQPPVPAPQPPSSSEEESVPIYQTTRKTFSAGGLMSHPQGKAVAVCTVIIFLVIFVSQGFSHDRRMAWRQGIEALPPSQESQWAQASAAKKPNDS